MADEQNPNGGTSGGSAGSGSDKDKGGQGEMVSRQAYEGVTQDLHKLKNELKELRAKNAEEETKRLAESNNFKALYENEVKKREGVEKEFGDFKGFVLHDKKYDAVKLEASSMGLKKEALSDLENLDLSGMNVETTSSGRFIVHGAKERADKLKTEKPHWFGEVKAPTVNSGGGAPPPNGGDGNKKLTADDVNMAETNWKRGKITQTEYHNIHKKYCEQQKVAAIPAYNGQR